MNKIGKRIIELREKRGISLSQLAREAGMSKSYLSQIEHGRFKSPSADIMYRVASALGTTIADILEEQIIAVEENYHTVPAPLRDLVRTKGELLDIRDEDVRLLARIRYRGLLPKRSEDYEYILQTLRIITRGQTYADTNERVRGEQTGRT